LYVLHFFRGAMAMFEGLSPLPQAPQILPMII